MMPTTRAFVVLYAFSLSVSTLLTGTATAAELTPSDVWMSDFAEAEAQARKLNRPLVVHFYAPWCGPCRQMERQVLNSPQLLKTLHEGFVAVKVNTESERGGQVTSRFKIQGLPTDMVLSPEGKVLVRTQGYQPTDKPKYMASISRIDASYHAGGKGQNPTHGATDDRNASDEPAKPSNRKDVIAGTVPRAGQQNGPNRLVPDPVEPKIIPGDSADVATDEPAPAPIADAEKVAIALDGYCPVTLRMTRTWKEGDKNFTAVHQGLTYRLLGEKEVEMFREKPEKFVPRLLGCDPVALTESDLAVPGSTKFGAFYDGSLFLFETADARAKFRKNPQKYTRVRHVLKPEDIRSGVRLTSRQ